MLDDDPSTQSSGVQVEVDTSFTGSEEQLEGNQPPIDEVAPTAQSKDTVPTSKVVKPPKPTMGGVADLGDGTWSAWTGGKPKTDWSGLDPSAETENTSPHQLRPASASASQKGYTYRCYGGKSNRQQFKPGSDLVAFQLSVWAHLKSTGMDSIAYLPDPEDNSKMSNVVQAHSRYTVQSAQLLVQDQLVKYDKNDKENNIAAKTYLLDSLVDTLSSKINEKLEEADPFPIVWLQFLKSIQSTSIERFEVIKTSIKSRRPSQYSGENLEQLAAQFRKDALELTTAGQYDHHLTLSMLEIFLTAGGTGNEAEDFRFSLRTIKVQLETALLEIAHKEKSAANTYMTKQKLTYRDICTTAEDNYRSRSDRGRWPPARNLRNLKDSKAPPKSFGNVAEMNDSPMTRAEVMTLMQMKPSVRFGNSVGAKKPGTCNTCGKPGHWSRECPDNNKQKSTNPRFQRQGGRQGGRQGSRPSNDRNARKPGWRSTPPAPGAPTVKTTDTHTFNWCAKCKRWSTTHSTETHTGGTAQSNNGSPAAMTAGLVQDPSVWITEVGVRPSFGDMLFVVRNLPIVVKVLLTINLIPLSMLFVSLTTVLFQPIAQFFTSDLGQFSWRMIVDLMSKSLDTLLVFLQHRYDVLLAPILWFVLANALLWTPNDTGERLGTVSLDDGLTRRQRRRSRRDATKRRRRAFSPPKRSIRTEGFHRRYPINLRALGRFIRRPPPLPPKRCQWVVPDRREHLPVYVTPEQMKTYLENNRDTICPAKLKYLETQVFKLTQDVRALQRSSARTRMILANPTFQPPERPVPNANREGDNRHVGHVEHAHQSPPDTNRFSRARRTPNRSHPGPVLPAGSPIPPNAFPSPITSRNTRQSAPNARRPPAPVMPDRAESQFRPQPHLVPSDPFRSSYPAPSGGITGHPDYTYAYISPRMARRNARNNRTTAHAQMAQLNLTSASPSMNVALHAPTRFRNALSQGSTFSVIWDSGASVTISPNKDDFVGPINSPSTITQLRGIAKGLRIEGQGQVRWSVHDTAGGLRHLTLPAYYVPKIRVRLLSTTSLLQTYSEETIKVEAHQLTLSGVPGCPDRTSVTARVNPDNNLPTSAAHREQDTPQAAECLNATITAVNDSNLNLSEPEKELLRWHYRLGHIGFKRIQFLMRTGVLTRSNNKKHLHQAACKIEHPPKCAACQFGKQHRRPAPGKTSTIVKDRVGVLKQDHVVPGQQVSVDHFVCSTKGRLFTSKGKTADNELYVGGCLFNDHASGHVHVEFQKHLTTHETLMSKENYELMCRDNGVIPQSYLSDNAKCFTAKEYTEKLSLFQQIARFAGVGAHHHTHNFLSK